MFFYIVGGGFGGRGVSHGILNIITYLFRLVNLGEIYAMNF